jgi:hypothetical protein
VQVEEFAVILARAASVVTYAESRHHLTEDRSYFYRIDGQEARED